MTRIFSKVATSMFVATFLLPNFTLGAQDSPASAKPAPAHKAWDTSNNVLRTYHLASVTQQNDANEILIAIRNIIDPSVKIYLVANQNAIVVSASPDQQEVAQTIIKELDRLKPTYRIKYTLSEIDNGKRSGVQHYSMMSFDGQRNVVKQGSKVPVITGSSNPADKTSTVYQYLDVGMNFDTTATRAGDTITLKNKVEQSSVAEVSTMSSGAQEPVVRQSVFEGVESVALGRPTVIGSFDVPDSTRRVEIEVLVELAN